MAAVTGSGEIDRHPGRILTRMLSGLSDIPETLQRIIEDYWKKVQLSKLVIKSSLALILRVL